MVRNSEILGTLVEIVQGPESSLGAVEIAGRGIAAEARCTLAVLADKGTPYSDPFPVAVQRVLSFSDRLIEHGEIGDSLVDLWQRRRTAEIDDAAFDATLSHLVRRLEEWPETAFPGVQ